MGVIKKDRLTSFVNAPLFIWFISVIFITLAGAYYTRHQQCVMDAEALAERYKNVSSEIDLRRSAISNIVSNAKSFEEIEQQIKTLPNIYRDFSGTNLEELTQQQMLMERRISFEEADDLYKRFTKGLKEIDLTSLMLYNSIYVGRTNWHGLGDLQQLKVFVADYFLAAHRRFSALGFFNYEPNCGWLKPITSVFEGRRARIVLAKPGVFGQLFDEWEPVESGPMLPPPFLRVEPGLLKTSKP